MESKFTLPPNKKRILICGRSGSGKTHLLNLLLQNGFNRCRSCTSRKPRIGEESSEEYYFVSEQKVFDLIREDEAICYTQLGGNWYALERKEFNKDKAVFCIIPSAINLLSLKQIKESLIIYLDVPDELRLERLKERVTNKENALAREQKEAEEFFGFKCYDVCIDDPLFTLDSVFDRIKKKNDGESSPFLFGS